MATLADMLRYRESLRQSRYNGARVFQDANGERVEYRSDRELAAAMAALEAEIAALQSKTPSRITFLTSKGV